MLYEGKALRLGNLHLQQKANLDNYEFWLWKKWDIIFHLILKVT